jgi:hypothetical protein
MAMLTALLPDLQSSELTEALRVFVNEAVWLPKSMRTRHPYCRRQCRSVAAEKALLQIPVQ